MRWILPLVLATACGGSGSRVERVRTQAGVALLPAEQIADLRGPTALRIVGNDRRLPVWLHTDARLQFHAVAARCEAGRCEVDYWAGDDRFVCSCTGTSYGPDGTAIGRRAPPLVSYPVVYRNRTVLIELRPASR